MSASTQTNSDFAEDTARTIAPTAFAGPIIHGNPTTVTLYSPSQLVDSPLIPSIFSMTNTAFSTVQARNGTLPASLQRFQAPGDFLQQLGDAEDTFIYILTWTDDERQVIATAGASRYAQSEALAKPDPARGDIGLAVTRVRLPKRAAQLGDSAEIWTLNFLATDVEVQGHGLGVFMTDLVDAEVKRRFLTSEARSHRAEERRELWMVLTSRKDTNHGFYKRRGYEDDDERVFGPGFLASKSGFSVVDMSKMLDT